MLRYPLWKNLLVVFLGIFGVIYALPTLYPDEPALQITGASASVKIDAVILAQAEAALSDGQIAFHDSTVEEKSSALLRVADETVQLKAQAVLRKALGDNYVVALNLAPTTPYWLQRMGAHPMKLGLDLRGGVHFLMQVDMDKAIEQRQEVAISETKKLLRDKKVAYRGVSAIHNGLEVKFDDAKVRDDAEFTLRNEMADFQATAVAHDDAWFVQLVYTPAKLKEIQDYAVNQNLTTLRNRVNELGVAEPVVQRQGLDRIVIELPGVQDTAEAKRVLGRTASLEFRFVDWEHSAAVNDGSTPAGTERFAFRENRQPPQLLQKRKLVTGDRVVNAKSSFDENGQPKVDITLDARGGKLMAEATRDNVGRPMAVLFVESKQRTRYEVQDGKEVEIREPYVIKEVINVATVQSVLGSQFQITGLDSPQEASELALLLRAGALAAPMYFVQESTIGPSLGAENIKRGFHSTMWGFAAIALFMIVYYQIFGVISVIALAFNLVFLVSLLAMLQATLTLPGIAAIALALGMAIDANVLINERIREELRNGAAPVAAITAGYERAFGTIVDSNVTTFIVGLMLLLFGSGPVRGFAVVHCLGILTSIFSAVVLSRGLVNIIYGKRVRLTSLAIGQIWKSGSTTASSKQEA